MADFSALFSERNLIDRVWFLNYGTFAGILVPAGAGIIRAHALGAGGNYAGGGFQIGGGGAFARVTTTCTPAEALSVKVGQRGSNGAAGDSSVTRTTGSVVLVKAVSGTASAGGASASCIGDVKRSGGDPAPYNSFGRLRHSGHDLDDTYSLGFGGRGAGYNIGASNGGGGCSNVSNPPAAETMGTPPGHGKVCLEFFKVDPGYGA